MRSAPRALVVHPAADFAYASWLLDGFAALLGPDAIHYSTEGFPPGYGGGRTLACYRADDPETRAFLVFTDRTAINEGGKKWATVYGSANVDAPAGDDNIPLGPNFGIRLVAPGIARRHLEYTWRWAARSPTGAPGTKRRIQLAWARTRSLYKNQRRRAPIHTYMPRESDPDYIFYTAWPWAKHPEVNPPRITFIEACRRAAGLTFEGGFTPRRRDDVPEVRPYLAPARYPLAEYLAKLGRSAIAYNNPAVHGCLGWKLGEFLAMGKAIVTLPIERALPAPLEHGVHVHVVDGSAASLDEAIARLRADSEYRQALEHNARRWYEAYLAPARVADRVLERMT